MGWRESGLPEMVGAPMEWGCEKILERKLVYKQSIVILPFEMGEGFVFGKISSVVWHLYA